MDKLFNKKLLSKSNIIFVVLLAIFLIPTSREWVMRQIAFSPSIENVENLEKIKNYNWSLKGLNTESLNFEDLQGKVIFVNFWATWCPPCRAEMPMIQKLYDGYKDKINFIFVTNENWAVVDKFFIKKNYNLPVYNSTSFPPEIFTRTNSIPASYLIDTEGNILISETGAADWNSDKVRELIDNLLEK